MKRAVQLLSDNGTTRNKAPDRNAISGRRKVGRPYPNPRWRDQALQARGGGVLALPLQVRARSSSRSADFNQVEEFVLREMPNHRHIPSWQEQAPAIQAVGAHDRPLPKSHEQIVPRLWRSGHQGLRPLDQGRRDSNRLRVFCFGHGRCATRNDARTVRQQRRLSTCQLCLGKQNGPEPQPQNSQRHRVSRRNVDAWRVGRTHGDSLFHPGSPIQIGVVSRARSYGAVKQVAPSKIAGRAS